jgi:hypothetical protein
VNVDLTLEVDIAISDLIVPVAFELPTFEQLNNVVDL